MIKAAFLDRDGVLNKDFGYVSKKENFIWCDGAKEALLALQSLGYTLFIITNQSGIARGYYSQNDFLNLTKWMLDELKKDGIFIKKVYFCPHDEKANCACRKPKAGMILQAKDEFSVDLANSILVGDKKSDIQAGLNAGISKNFLIGKEYKNLQEISQILQNQKF